MSTMTHKTDLQGWYAPHMQAVLRRVAWILLLATALLLLVGARARAADATFTGIGFATGDPAARQSAAYAVSADGKVAVGLGNTPAGPRAIRWTAATGVSVLSPLGWQSVAEGASADGSVIVGTFTAPDFTYDAFRWTAADGLVLLGRLPSTHQRYSRATGCSADGGVIVGHTGTPDGIEGFRWTAADGLTPLGDLPGGADASYALGIAADGAQIVGMGWPADAASYHAVRWSSAPQQITVLEEPADFAAESAATAVSADGTTCAGVARDAAGNSVAVRWTAAGVAPLAPHAEGVELMPFAVSADGGLIGGRSSTTSGAQRAFIWTAGGGVRDVADVLREDFGLDPGFWTLQSVRGIAADGETLCGEGIDPHGYQQGWIAHLPGGKPGDMNCDGLVNNMDVDPFVTALLFPQEFSVRYPGCNRIRADINADGAVNNFDIDPFVALLLGQ